MRDGGLQELDEGHRGGVVRQDREHGAAAQDGLAQVTRCGRGHVEEVGILPHDRALREEGRDEAGLTVQVAGGRAVEQAGGAFAEIGRADRSDAARDEIGVLGEPAELVDRGHDLGVVERHRVGRPGVVILRRGGAQHQVLDPVGRGPAGGAARSQADAPGGLSLLGDLLGQGLQVLVGLGDLITRILEVLGYVPDQRLDVGLVGEGVQRLGPVGARIGAQRRPAFARGIVVGQPLRRLLAKGAQEALLGQVRGKARLRKDRDIGGRSGLAVDDDLLLEAVGTGIVRLRARRLVEIGDDRLEQFLVAAQPRAQDVEALPLKVGMRGLELVQAGPVDAVVAARFDHQLRLRAARGQRDDRSGRVQCGFQVFLPESPRTCFARLLTRTFASSGEPVKRFSFPFQFLVGRGCVPRHRLWIGIP